MPAKHASYDDSWGTARSSAKHKEILVKPLTLLGRWFFLDSTCSRKNQRSKGKITRRKLIDFTKIWYYFYFYSLLYSGQILWRKLEVPCRFGDCFTIYWCFGEKSSRMGGILWLICMILLDLTVWRGKIYYKSLTVLREIESRIRESMIKYWFFVILIFYRYLFFTVASSKASR